MQDRMPDFQWLVTAHATTLMIVFAIYKVPLAMFDSALGHGNPGLSPDDHLFQSPEGNT